MGEIAEEFGELRVDGGGPTEPDVATGRLVPFGRRNTELFLKLKDAAFSCTTHHDLLDLALDLNQRVCEEPLPTNELVKMVRWLWHRKQVGELWRSGEEARAVVRRSEWEPLDPDALKLLTGLRISHGAERGKLFAVASAPMAKRFQMGPRRITRARARLLELGFLQQVGRRGAKGRPTKYRLRQKV